MRKRIFRGIFGASLLVFIASVALIMGVLYDYFSKSAADELRNSAIYLSAGVSNDGMNFFKEIKIDTKDRITWIAQDGTVLYDNTVNASEMENHLNREEIQKAAKDGEGKSIRYSDTIAKRTVNYAVRLEDGSFIRVSDEQYTFVAILAAMTQTIALGLLIAILLSAFVANRISNGIIRPINEIDPEKPENAKAYDEILPLLKKITAQNRQIDEQMQILRRKQQEFSAITENMREGFLVLDTRADILSYNTSALKILGIDRMREKQNVLTVNRSESFRRAVENALSGKAFQENTELSGRVFQLIANPVRQDGNTIGAVIIILDVTEKEEREKLRREFSANVSHELKTPLTAISGTAEILKNGLVKKEDVPRFAENIYHECSRLIQLINDIIELSRLDEREQIPKNEKIDLGAVALQTAENLKEYARGKNVSLRVLADENCFVFGTQEILSEMIYNLCDNAIKYNQENGSVTVSVTAEKDGRIVLTVSDTGIGIPDEDKERVFERFYRVNKSHSKEVGGTGLGLSIVKHAAICHQAELMLDSKLGEGTSVRVSFPACPETIA